MVNSIGEVIGMMSPRMISPLEDAREELLREASLSAEASGREKALEESAPPRSFLVFSMGMEWCGVDLSNVRRVLRASRIARVSGASPEVLGLMNCQGEVLCVLDLRRILGAEKGNDSLTGGTEGKYIVVVESNGREAGFLVDSVLDVRENPASSILPVLESIDPTRARLFEGTMSYSGRFVGLLSASACMNP